MMNHERSMLSLSQRAANALFGYDYFISYAHQDGKTYATALCRALRQRGRQCFIDSDRFRTGDDWEGVGSWALRNTTCLVVVGSPGALKSDPVAKEVRWFRSLKRQVIPIDFEGTLDLELGAEPSPLKALLPPTILRLREGARLETGPSESAIAQLVSDLHGITQDRKRAGAMAAAAAGFAALSAGLGYWVVQALRNERAAKAAEGDALDAKARAEVARNVAATEAARGSFALSLTDSELQADAWSALVRAVHAANTLPNAGATLNQYLSRVLHLADRLADQIVVLPVNERLTIAAFSAQLDRVAVVTETARVQAFELPHARALVVPPGVDKRGSAGLAPEFLDGGKTLRVVLAWNHPEPDPDERGQYVLDAAWNLDSGTAVLPVDTGRGSVDDLKWGVLRADGLEGLSMPRAIPEPAPAIKRRLTPWVGLRSGAGKVATVSADGRVMIWPTKPQGALLQTMVLEGAVRLSSSVLGQDKVFAIDANEGIGAWDLSTGKRVWSRRATAPTGRQRRTESPVVELSRDDQTLRADGLFLDASTGKKLVDLGAENLDDYNHRLANAQLEGYKILSALVFWTGNNDELVLRIRDTARPDGTDAVTAELKPGASTAKTFMGFLADAQYLLDGHEGSFRLVHWRSGRTVSVFRLDQRSRLPPELAVALLLGGTRVDERAATGKVQVTLRDGATVVAEAAPAVTGALLVAGQALQGPQSAKPAMGAKESLSGDGHWLATSGAGQVRVFEARSGAPLTEAASFAGDLLALRMSHDGSEVVWVTSIGICQRMPALMTWGRRPVWTQGMAEALSGLGMADDGRVLPVGATQRESARAAVLVQLRADVPPAPGNIMLRRKLGDAS